MPYGCEKCYNNTPSPSNSRVKGVKPICSERSMAVMISCLSVSLWKSRIPMNSWSVLFLMKKDIRGKGAAKITHLNISVIKSSSCSDSGIKRCPPSSMHESSADEALAIGLSVKIFPL